MAQVCGLQNFRPSSLLFSHLALIPILMNLNRASVGGGA